MGWAMPVIPKELQVPPPVVQLRPAEVQVKAMPVIPKEFQVPPLPPVLPPPPANFVGVYQLGGPGHGSRPPLFGPPVTGRTQVSASERTPCMPFAEKER